MINIKKRNNSKNKIKKENMIGDIVENNPKAVELLAEYGLYCIGCPLGQFETLEEGARVHGMSDKEIEKMIEEINAQIE